MLSRKIDGTWFEFFHHSQVEGQYWNPACRAFTADQWRQKLQEIAGLGMEYIVLLCTSLAYSDHAESYFPGGPYPFPEEMACKNPMEVLFDECDQLGLRIFVSCGFYGDWTQARANMVSQAVRQRAFAAMEQLHRLYGAHPSFYGWYLPDEIGIDGNFPGFFIDYVNAYRAQARAISPSKPLLIAPYGVAKVVADAAYIDQLKQLDCDFVAYQDGVGIHNAGAEESAQYYKSLRMAHDAAGRSRLWADVELFQFEGAPYRSALRPAQIGRVVQQLEAVAPYVDKILVYQYQGMMNPPNSQAFCGAPESAALYRAYRQLIHPSTSFCTEIGKTDW